MDNTIFRQKSIDKVSSPEKLDDYIRVTTPGIWLTIAAVAVLLAGAAVWALFGEVETVNENGETCKVSPISYIIN